MDNTKLLWFAEAGGKKRTSTIYSFLTKGHDASFNKNAGGEWEPNENHLVQTIELNQPYLRGNIAPNEVLCAYSGEDDNKFFTHPQISFAADEAWSIAIALNSSFNNKQSYIIGNNNNGNSIFGIHYNDSQFCLYNQSGDSGLGVYNTLELIGKNSVIHLTANGNSSLDIYVNKLLVDTILMDTNITISQVAKAISSNGYSLNGKLFYHRIQSGAMTVDQVASEAAMIRTWLPEVESVQIGAQHWTTSNLDIVCTPQGNVISELQLGANEERITDGIFSDAGNYSIGTGWSISGGKLVGNNATGNVSQNTLISPTAWYKYSIDCDQCDAGDFDINLGGYDDTEDFTTVDTHTGYLKTSISATNIAHLRARNSFTGELDNWSVEKVGWAGLGDLYTWLTTEGGYSVADALKECGAWCYYNNDPANGAIYGKLYNWYAVKLLQDDIDAYNLANPATPWGWKVPTEADFNTLATTLGGDAVAGGKMKMIGEDYWNTPNTGADNSSILTSLGCGKRNNSGTFLGLKSNNNFFVTDELDSTVAKRVYLSSNNAQLGFGTDYKLNGFSLRLIKS